MHFPVQYWGVEILWVLKKDLLWFREDPPEQWAGLSIDASSLLRPSWAWHEHCTAQTGPIESHRVETHKTWPIVNRHLFYLQSICNCRAGLKIWNYTDFGKDLKTGTPRLIWFCSVEQQRIQWNCERLRPPMILNNFQIRAMVDRCIRAAVDKKWYMACIPWWFLIWRR